MQNILYVLNIYRHTNYKFINKELFNSTKSVLISHDILHTNLDKYMTKILSLN